MKLWNYIFPNGITSICGKYKTGLNIDSHENAMQFDGMMFKNSPGLHVVKNVQIRNCLSFF